MIEAISFKNYRPYRGDHTLQLSPGVTLIEARGEEDPNKSNMSGKSYLTEVPLFLLYGYSRGSVTRTPTFGEDDCYVSMVMDGKEYRKEWGGKSFKNVTGSDPAISKDLALATWYVMGVDANSLFLMTPTKRQEMLVPLFCQTLDYWEDVNGRYREQWSKVKKEIKDLEVKLADLEKEIQEGGSIEELQKEKEERETLLNAANQRMKDALQLYTNPAQDEVLKSIEQDQYALEQEQRKANYHFETLKQSLKRKGELIHEYEHAKRSFNFCQTDLETYETRLAEASASLSDLAAEGKQLKGKYQELEKFQLGEGTLLCPYTNTACTGTFNATEIQETRELLKTQLLALKKVYEDKEKEKKQAQESLAVMTKAKQQREVAEKVFHNSMASLNLEEGLSIEAVTLQEAESKKKYETLKAKYQESYDTRLQEIEESNKKANVWEAIQMEVFELSRNLKDTEYKLERLEKLCKQVEETKIKALTLKDQERIYRLVKAVSSPSGVPGFVAARATELLEDSINSITSKLDAPFEVHIQPIGDTSTLEPECENCGYTFLNKTTTCPECGAKRANVKAIKFDLELSNNCIYAEESGGGRLIANLGIRLGMMEYIRRTLKEPMDTLILDEAFGGVLDAYRREVCYNELLMKLDRFGVKQTLITTHVPLAETGNERKVTVVKGENGSYLEIN